MGMEEKECGTKKSTFFKQIEIKDVEAMLFKTPLTDKAYDEAAEIFWKAHDKLMQGLFFQGYREVAECDPSEVDDYLTNIFERR